MFKKIIITISIALVLAITIIISRYYYMKLSYQKIEISMPTEKVLEIMGEPNTIYDYSMDGKNKIEWQYYQFPIPSIYSITIEEGVVIKKVVSISP